MHHQFTLVTVHSSSSSSVLQASLKRWVISLAWNIVIITIWCTAKWTAVFMQWKCVFRFVGRFMTRRERIDMMAKKFTYVYVKNFGDALDDDKMRTLFETCGTVTSCKVHCTLHTCTASISSSNMVSWSSYGPWSSSVLVVQRFGVRLVIERSVVRPPAAALSSTSLHGWS